MDKSQSRYVGKTVKEAIQGLRMTCNKDAFLEEPPGVLRGVIGVAPNNDEIYLYIPRKWVGADLAKFTIEDIVDTHVIGIAIKHESRWITAGQVIGYYHFNLNR